jgi:hypothetical protein
MRAAVKITFERFFIMGADNKTKKSGNKKIVKSNKKQIKHDPQAESARTIFGKDKSE